MVFSVALSLRKLKIFMTYLLFLPFVPYGSGEHFAGRLDGHHVKLSSTLH